MTLTPWRDLVTPHPDAAAGRNRQAYPGCAGRISLVGHPVAGGGPPPSGDFQSPTSRRGQLATGSSSTMTRGAWPAWHR